MNKILDLIFEDVKNENETKKTAVTLRISALIFIGYFLCLMAVFCGMGDWMNVGGCLVCGVCYVLSFYTTYWNHTRESAWISQILMIVWIILFIVFSLMTFDGSFLPGNIFTYRPVRPCNSFSKTTS